MIEFATVKLQKICNCRKAAERTCGPERATKVRLRLDDLAAASTLEDMRCAPGRCHERTGNDAGVIPLDLDGPYRLIFEPAEQPPPTKPDGGLDWQAVTAVRILGIDQPHGD
ncbi:MAG: killer suppression protein [Candidatus Latescibacterota bacterium]